MGVVIDHVAVVGINIIINTYDIGFTDNGEVIGKLGSVGGWIVLNDGPIFAPERTTGFIGIACGDMRDHFVVDCFRNTHCEIWFCYHNIFASKLSSRVCRSRVHRSSLRYFQPPSASSTTILPCCILSATRKAACRDAPQDGPAKMPSWSL